MLAALDLTITVSPDAKEVLGGIGLLIAFCVYMWALVKGR